MVPKPSNPRANNRNIVTCCVRLNTLLHVVGSCCAKFNTGQTFGANYSQHFFCSVIAEA